MMTGDASQSAVLAAVMAAVVVFAWLVNGLLTPAVTRLAHRHKWYDIPDSRKLHTGLIPRIGGLGIFVSMALAIGFGFVGLALLDRLTATPAAPLIAAAVGVAMIFGVGLYDDFVPLRARTKLLLQVIAATIVAASGMRVDSIAIPLLGNLHLGGMAVPLTVFWIVGMTNSVNLIDGIDGLAGGISAIAAACMAIIALLQGHLLTALVALALFGSLGGFLLYNWPPASIFMGDSGSHLLGFALAILPFLDIGGAATLGTLVVPATLVLIPIVDCGAATVRRIRQRRSVGSADTDHIHYVLRALGMSDRKILLAVYSVCGYLAVVAITSTLLLRGAAIYLIMFMVSWAGVLLAYGILVALHAHRKQRRGETGFQRDAGSNGPRQA
ncbi:MAG: MraY family glycosyltransferase [Spirochaetaceae bacterium]|nr:MraY family glycosyltransferase [Spirochaetaceae bacterium]